MDIDQLDQAAAWFANRLFDGRIAATTFRLESDPNYLGVYKGWSSKTGHSIGFNDELHRKHRSGIISELITVVHEQCHAWRAVEGIPEGDGHDVLWTWKMTACGLMPRWNRLTLTWDHQILPTGKFIVAALELAGHFGITA